MLLALVLDILLAFQVNTYDLGYGCARAWLHRNWLNHSYTDWSEKAMAPHSSTLAWKIPWTEEPGRLQSMGSLGVGHNWASSLSLFTFMHWRRKWQPTPVFLPGESQGRGSLVGCRLWVAQSRTRLKRLSSSSSSILIDVLLIVSSLAGEPQWTCWFV